MAKAATKQIKDMAREELIDLCNEQSEQLFRQEETHKKEVNKLNEAHKQSTDNLVKLINEELAVLGDSFRSIQSTCKLATTHIAKIGK